MKHISEALEEGLRALQKPKESRARICPPDPRQLSLRGKVWLLVVLTLGGWVCVALLIGLVVGIARAVQ